MVVIVNLLGRIHDISLCSELMHTTLQNPNNAALFFRSVCQCRYAPAIDHLADAFSHSGCSGGTWATETSSVPAFFRTSVYLAVQYRALEVLALLLAHGLSPDESGPSAGDRRCSSASEIVLHRDKREVRLVFQPEKLNTMQTQQK